MKKRAFLGLLACRSWLQRAGVDRFVHRHSWIAVALQQVYHALYSVTKPSDLATFTIGGAKISVSAAQRDLALILRTGQWEPRQTRLLESLLAPGMTFIDVGAHIGYYTVMAARRVGASGRIYAFEPAPNNFRLLTKNIAQNNLENVVAQRLAVARRSGRAAFALSNQDSASHTLATTIAKSTETIEVETLALDDYFRATDTRVDVIKLDAEGAELGILEGMERLLAANPNVVLFTEVYPRAMEALGSSPEAFLERLTELGFSFSPFEEARTEALPLEPEDFSSFLADLRCRGTGINLLCRRKTEIQRIRKNSGAEIQSRPLVSIAIPTYNRGALLERTLETILAQLPPDFEIVICDTGSTDRTAQRIAPLAGTDSRIRFCSLPQRLNLDEALLELLTLSHGEYVWFFSSDDQMNPGAAETMRRRILNSREHPALVYMNQKILDDAGCTIISSQVRCNHDRDFQDGRAVVSWLGLDLGFISASAIQRETALAVSSAAEFVGTRSLNLHLYIECLLRGGPALYIGEPLVAARRASGPPPYQVRDVFVRDIVRIFRHARKRGFGRLRTIRAMQRTIVRHYLPLVVSWRSDNAEELARTFPVMLSTCWMYPAFWLLIVPVRLAPRVFIKRIRDYLRANRERRNRVHAPEMTPQRSGRGSGAAHPAGA